MTRYLFTLPITGLHRGFQEESYEDHNRLWNGGNGWGTVKLYDREDGHLILTDEVEASHIGCEYGEYDHGESY